LTRRNLFLFLFFLLKRRKTRQDKPRQKVRPEEKSLLLPLLIQKKKTSRVRKLDQKKTISSSFSSPLLLRLEKQAASES